MSNKIASLMTFENTVKAFARPENNGVVAKNDGATAVVLTIDHIYTITNENGRAFWTKEERNELSFQI